MSRATSSRSRTGRALLALAVAAVLLLGGRSTLAFWTRSASVSPGSIKSGSIDLKVDGVDNDSAFSTLALSGMQPGDTTAAIITVKNGGLSPLTYTVNAAATNADGKNLRSVLVVKVTTDSTVTGTGHARTCAGTAIAGSATSFTTGLVPTARTLAAGAQETLCVQATLPNAAPVSTTTTYQNASTAVTFAFNASQVIS
jgi:alternate signal-mediated exported protein